MKIWIAGAAGQLGCALNDMAKQYQPDAEIINTDIEEVDVTNLNQVIDFAKEKRPDVILTALRSQTSGHVKNRRNTPIKLMRSVQEILRLQHLKFRPEFSCCQRMTCLTGSVRCRTMNLMRRIR